MSIRLCVFDLDGTLAPPDGGLSPITLEKLRALSLRGVRIAVASGKPTFYLAGFFRMANFGDIILIGENGVETVFGIDLPPRHRTALPVSREVRATLRRLRDELEEAFPGIFFQPNTLAVTPCPRTPEEMDAVEAILDRGGYRTLLDVYRFPFCFDILPRGFSKAEGIRALAAELSLSADEVAAVGNDLNDYPMFAYAGLSIGINLAEPTRADRNFTTIEAALDYLLTLTAPAANERRTYEQA